VVRNQSPTGSLHPRLGELLCPGRCQGTYDPARRMVAKTNAPTGVETMEDPQEPQTKPTITRRIRILGETCGRVKSRTLATIHISPGKTSSQQCLLAKSGLTQLQNTISTSSYLTEPPGADPHARWCGRGAVARPPIPIAMCWCDQAGNSREGSSP
jgi:hypothetical protein